MKFLNFITLLMVIIVSLYIFLSQRNSQSGDIKVAVKYEDHDDTSFNLRVACLILTQIKNHKSRVRAIADTWGRRCTVLLYVTNSTVHLDDQKVFDIQKKDSYNTIWGKVKNALTNAYKIYKEEVDWFIKADDDSYIIMENVQDFIDSKRIRPSDPTWFGSHYHLFSKYGYMAGGGYVMSREAVRLFVEVGLNRKNNEGCKAVDDTGAEDAEMGKCMSTVGVVPTDSRDEYGRARNFPFSIESVTAPSLPSTNFWYWKNIKYPTIFGHPGCCSETASIFHYVTVPNMYKYEYLIYNTKVRGEKYGKRAPPPPETLVKNMDIDWKKIQSS